MEQSSENPPSNALPAFVAEEALLRAIEKSGFPLEIRVADALRAWFPIVQPEWSYVDPDTEASRTVDVYCRRSLSEVVDDDEAIRPKLDLLVECKQSQLPYVFFLTASAPRLDSPLVTGLKSRVVQISTDDDALGAEYQYDVASALSLNEHPFVAHVFPYASTFVRVERKKKELTLEGSDAYNHLVLPLLKAAQHFLKTHVPAPTMQTLAPGVLIPLAVLDAPMVGVWLLKDRVSLTMTPWIRVVRHIPDSDERELSDSILAIDVVHSSFLETYITKHVLPFADSFRSAIERHGVELRSGRGFVPNLRAQPSGIEHRLKPWMMVP